MSNDITAKVALITARIFFSFIKFSVKHPLFQASREEEKQM